MPYICSCSMLISRSSFSRSTTYHLPGNRVARGPQVRFDFSYARVEQRKKFCPFLVELRDHGNQILFGLLRNACLGSLQD